MKKRLMTMLTILLVVPVLLVAVAPVSKHVGKVDVFPDSGSITARAIEAVRMKLTPEWFEEFTTGDKALIDFWSDRLLEILPLENVVAGEEKDGGVSLYDLEKHIYISFTFNEDGIIDSMDIE